MDIMSKGYGRFFSIVLLKIIHVSCVYGQQIWTARTSNSKEPQQKYRLGTVSI